MPEHDRVYIERNPGDLITAEDWNHLQRQIRDDIEATSAEAAGRITHVASADDARSLDGLSVDELTEELRKRILDAVRAESGYRKVFKILPEGEVRVIEHGLGDCPLVDVYKLLHFEVVCREDDEPFPAQVTFYLHHSSEKRIRVTDGAGASRRGTRTVDIQPDGFPRLGIPFADMLVRYNVEYTDSTSLEDLEVEFWQAFFSEPNDDFDDLQYCHSPWFERCCREERDVANLKARGDWDEIWFQVRPLKIVGGPATGGDNDQAPAFSGVPVPANVAVAHLDLNRVALWLEGPALHGRVDDGPVEFPDAVPQEFRDELKLMVLLRA
ncbi:MAG TPA: hypothetical protein VHF25_16040 [Nitriliruptorales bacterium]|nr:hypothetical protein [Nitriliruptorales bacterium]